MSLKLLTAIGRGTLAAVLGAIVVSGYAFAEDLCIGMTGTGGTVAGVQLDVLWDGSCMSANLESGNAAQCRSDPSTGKNVQTAVKGTSLRALMFSMSDTNPMQDGNLFCCSFTRTGGAGCCGLSMGNVILASPTGAKVNEPGMALVASLGGHMCASSGPAGSEAPAARAPIQQGPSGGSAPPPVAQAPAPAAGGGSAPGGAPGVGSGSRPAVGAPPAAAPQGVAPEAPAGEAPGGEVPPAGGATPAVIPPTAAAAAAAASPRAQVANTPQPTPVPVTTPTPAAMPKAQVKPTVAPQKAAPPPEKPAAGGCQLDWPRR